MKRVEGTTVEFMCVKDEVVTIDITENNTDFLVSCAPQNAAIKLSGNTVTINIGDSIKTVTLGFDFNDSGGSYTLVLNGNKSDDSFTRNVSQPDDNLPETRTYVFHKSLAPEGIK